MTAASFDTHTRLERTAWDAQGAGRTWFTHPTAPGRILPSALGSGHGDSPCHQWCIHGDLLHVACPDCERDLAVAG